jgi:HK97 family phage major capsid protein
MPEVTVQDAIEAVGELRKEVTNLSPDLDKLEKLNALLDKQEEKGQAAFKEAEAAKGRQEELEAKFKDIELELARATPTQEKALKDLPEFKAMQAYCVKGDMKMSDGEKALLRTDADTQGGYLAPVEMDNAITKKITEISNIRAISRVRSISAKAIDIVVRSAIPVATWESETEAGADSTSLYARETVTPFRQTFTSPITLDMLMDAAFSMEGEIMSDAGEAFAKGEGAGFVSGTGVKEPEGFLTNTDVVAGALVSAASGVVDATDVILLTGELKVGYDPTYVMNRKTLAQLRTLKSTTGAFLWQPGLNGPVANTINGFPYILAQDMPDIASDSLSIAFGDFRRGYTIVDRTGLSVVRDEFTLKKQAIVEFTLSKWLTGQVTLPEAITLLKTKT